MTSTPLLDPTTLDALDRFPQLLAQHYAAIPIAFKHWMPPSWEGIPSESLTAIEQVCHLRDIEIEGYQLRFRRTLSETNPTLAAIDTDKLARERRYGDADAAATMEAFSIARKETVELIRSLSSEQLNRRATFEGYGAVTLRSLIHYLCSHDQQHLAGLQWLLGKIEAHRVGG